MPTTFNNNLRIAEIGTGEQAGVWGNTTNTNLATLITEAITGVAAITISSDQALTALDGATDQARQAVLLLGGTPAGAFTLYVPPVDKIYIIKNGTGQTATISASTLANGTTPTGGTTIAIPNGFTALIYCDSTNIADGVNRINGNLSVSGDGTFGTATANTGVFTTLSASGDVNFTGTGAMQLPAGTTAQRPTPVTADLRYNTSFGRPEVYNSTEWVGLGGATGGGGDNVFYENSQTVTTSYTITSGDSAMSTGPITINVSVTVTVPTGSRWVIL